jgi:thiosulfate dehydrogenase
MKKLILAIVFLCGALYAGSYSIEDSKQISVGGQLYDNWYGLKGVEAPEGTNPAYTGKKTGATTWRCKECHGWDLKGAAGGYSSGSHFTGIKGITAYRDANLKDIVAILKDDIHQYGTLMSDAELTAIATFVSKAQIDTPFIDMKTKRVTGDAIAGGVVFQATCAKCHGLDGKLMNFKKLPKEVFIGDAVRGNPQEATHKVRFGHPGTDMTSFFVFKDSLIADILAYAQDLK